jgi:hypothetical protein
LNKVKIGVPKIQNLILLFSKKVQKCPPTQLGAENFGMSNNNGNSPFYLKLLLTFSTDFFGTFFGYYVLKMPQK